MIRQSDLVAIGRFLKPHGIDSEINFDPFYDGLDITLLRAVVVEIDGIFVPFFVDKVRQKGATLLLHIDRLPRGMRIAELTNRTAYALTDDVDMTDDTSDDDGGMSARSFIDWTVVDDDTQQVIGKVDDLDTQTDNWLFIVETPDGRTVRIPVADEFITLMEPEERRFFVSLPAGLLEL